MKTMVLSTASAIMLLAGTASATAINGHVLVPRLYNDFSTTTLTITDNFASSVRVQETDFADDGAGGNFANRHVGWFSADGGATAYDYNYGDGFYMSLTVQDSSVGLTAEAGFGMDLFGFGVYGLVGGGGIGAFIPTMPFHFFGSGLHAPGDVVDLAMVYRPGAGEFAAPVSTMEYLYQVNGGGWVSSGQIPFGNTEGGIPSGGWSQLIGWSAQFNQPIGGSADVLFSNIYAIPTPASAALLGVAGLAGLRRRR